MKIKTTEWRPSHCSCVIEYTWDADVPESSRTHTAKSHKHCGGDHPVLVDGESVEGSDFHHYHIALNASKELEKKLLMHKLGG